MEKAALGLIAAVGALVPLGGASAAVAPNEAQRVLHAASVAELLEPIPNAMGVMKATETERTAQAEEQQKLAQVYSAHHHHHHHHHRYRHHHHHHWRYHHHHHHYYY
jgi:ribulose kinase